MKYLKQIAFVLLLIGGLNWGIYGVSERDLVDILLGSVPVLASIVYVLIGLSALYIIFARLSLCAHHTCSSCDTCSDCSTCCTVTEPKKPTATPVVTQVEEPKKEA